MIEAECLEEHRVGALEAVGDDDDRHAVEAQRSGLAEVERVVGVDAAPAADSAVEQGGDSGRRLERLGELDRRRRG